MQLKRQFVEAWQNEKHYSKGNNTSENPIPRQEIFKPVDHVKYEGHKQRGKTSDWSIFAGKSPLIDQ